MISKLYVTSAPGSVSRGILTAGNMSFSCVLGRSGITTRKREGDGATPTGSFKLLNGYFRKDRMKKPNGLIALKKTQDHMGWCDQPEHANYNREINLPFEFSHETLCRKDRLYDICIVLDQNIHPRKRNGGSAIFLHLTSPGRKPTEGCVALDPTDMVRLLPMLSKNVEMIISK